MKVTLLKNNPSVYSCNVYYIRGDWNRIDDVNTLIDCGTNGFIIDELESLNGGLGKRRVEQVILTHEHFDHSGGLKWIKKEYNPISYGYVKSDLIDFKARDQKELQIGDKIAKILHTPGHSHDSICVFEPETKSLFSGDTPLIIRSTGGTYTLEFIEVLRRLISLDINFIYPGHGDIITENATDILKYSLKNVRKSTFID
jgi:glyoxylase-like metal-dependent hydrolase (beta-lactamase superfamily II)